MTAHNDRVEAVARVLAPDSVSPEVSGLSDEAAERNLRAARRDARLVLTLMEERGWLKADASRSVPSPEAAGGWMASPLVIEARRLAAYVQCEAVVALRETGQNVSLADDLERCASLVKSALPQAAEEDQ